MHNSTSKLLLTMILGVVLGWLLHFMVGVINHEEEPRIALGENQYPISNSQQNEVIEPETISINETEPTQEREDFDKTNSLTDVQSILKYLSGFKGDYENFSTLRSNIEERLKESTELRQEFLESLVDIEDKELRLQATFALWTAKSEQEGNFEPWLVERIESGDRADEWLKIWEVWGVTSRNTLNTILGQLANNPDPKMISASVKVINATMRNYPLAMSPNQRKVVSDQLRPYLNSNEDSLRLIAVRSLDYFPQDGAAQILLNAFDDPSAKVRMGALENYMLKPVLSAEIQSRVMAGLRDNSRSYFERYSLANLAMKFELSDKEQAEVQGVETEANQYFAGLSQEEQRALTEEFN